MKQLPNQFVGIADQGPVGGLPAYHFKILKREGQICLLEKSRGGVGAKFYEVVMLRSVPSKTFPNGVTTPAHEAMPSPEMWGTSAWSPHDLEAAERKFMELTEMK